MYKKNNDLHNMQNKDNSNNIEINKLSICSSY